MSLTSRQQTELTRFSCEQIITSGCLYPSHHLIYSVALTPVWDVWSHLWGCGNRRLGFDYRLQPWTTRGGYIHVVCHQWPIRTELRIINSWKYWPEKLNEQGEEIELKKKIKYERKIMLDGKKIGTKRLQLCHNHTIWFEYGWKIDHTEYSWILMVKDTLHPYIRYTEYVTCTNAYEIYWRD